MATNRSKPAFLPPSWDLDGLAFSDVREDEVDLVAKLHQSRSEVGAVDPSFVPVSHVEYERYVRSSLAGEADGDPFRLQVMRWESEPCGYFHAYGHHPFPGCFFISMFLIIPAHARHGLGRKAAAGIVAQANALGFERILLSVFLANRAALSFWIDQGFDRIEKFRRSDDSGKPDRFVLEMRL